MEYIIAVLLAFFVVLGLMFASSSERNPTPQQIRNQIIFNRWIKKWKKRLTPDEIIFPMILGIIILGFVGYMATQL